MMFREGILTEEVTWQAVVLIPKGGKDYWGIGLVEVMWKVVAEILNRRLIASIAFHNSHNASDNSSEIGRASCSYPMR